MTDVSEAEGWAKGLDELAGRLGPRFGRVEPRRRLLAYLRGLLAPLGRKKALNQQLCYQGPFQVRRGR